MSKDKEIENLRQNEDGTSLKAFASETSAHGVRNVFSSKRNIIIRLVWFLCVVGAAVSLGVTLYNVAIQYYTYPFLTVTHTVPRHEMTFPAVTVCNINPFDTSNYEYSEQVKDIMVRFTTDASFKKFNFTDPPYSLILNTSMKELTDALSPPTTSFLLQCLWHNRYLRNCEELFTPVYTLFGLCYVFNANESSRYSASQIGSSSGLRVIFNINQNHGVVTSDYSAGLKILLHEPHELPDLLNQGFVVSTGHSTNVAVTKNEVQSTEFSDAGSHDAIKWRHANWHRETQKILCSANTFQFRFLPYPYKAFGDEACVETSSEDFPIKVNYSSVYSLSACLSECAEGKALNVCDCKHPSQADADQAYCSFLQGATCFIPTWFHSFDEARTNNTCDCPRPCSFVRYQTRMSTSSFPSVATGDMIIDFGMAKSLQQTRTDFGEFRIYYEDLMLYQTKHEPQFSLTSVMATIGGQMGFFLGASLMTVVEFGEFILLLLGRLCKGALLRLSTAGQRRGNNNIVQVKPIT